MPIFNLSWTTVRDILLFVAGVAGLAHEVLLTNTERPTLLILFAAMMGLPAVLRQDTAKPPEIKPKDEPKQLKDPKGNGESQPL